MTKNLPDKYLRKAVFLAINNIVVDGVTVPCYDRRITTNDEPKAYCLVTAQSNQVVRANKCEDRWDSSILIEVFTRYPKAGNYGSRLLADNILDEVRRLTDNLTLDAGASLTNVYQRQSFPDDLVTETSNEIIFRKFMRIEITLN